jgi:hypothetical protein
LDYQGNSRKDREKQDKEKPEEKKIEKVVTGEVVQKSKGIGRKFKSIFFGGDFKIAARYVSADVLLPALRNLFVDIAAKGADRLVYGDSAYRRGARPPYESRTQYNNPLYYRADPRERSYTPSVPDQAPRYRREKKQSHDFVLATRSEAEIVVEQLLDIIEKYEVVSLADLHALLGLPSGPIDNKWGWTYLNNITITQVRDGFLVEFPPLEEI